MGTAEESAMAHDADRSDLQIYGRKGGWLAALFILGTEAAERLAFYSIAANLVTYLTQQMHEPLPTSVTLVSNWVGAAYVLSIPGAFLADSYLGRFLTIAIYCVCYILGLCLLTVSASVKSLTPPPCSNALTSDCPRASKLQMGVLLGGLYMIALGTGGIKPCVSPFGADQLIGAISDSHNVPKTPTKSSGFFNWFFFSVNVGALVAYTVVVWVQDDVGWTAGFAIPLSAMVGSLVLFLAGKPLYCRQPPAGSPLTRFARVFLAAVKNWKLAVPVRDNGQLEGCRMPRFLDKASMVPDWDTEEPSGTCTRAQVEELQQFLRILPVLAATVFLWTGYTQLLTFFVKQGATMNRNLGPHFQIPPASLPVFSVLNALIVLPVYDRVVVPFASKFLTADKRGFRPLQRMGFALLVSTLSMVVAGVVERRRLRSVAVGATPMSIFWLVPQYVLVSLAEIFMYVGQLEFFYDVSKATCSISTSLFISELGVGSWLSSVLVTLVRHITGSQPGHGWILDDMNSSQVYRFYWLLAVLSAINFLLFVVVAHLYSYSSQRLAVASSPVINAAPEEKAESALLCGIDLCIEPCPPYLYVCHDTNRNS